MTSADRGATRDAYEHGKFSAGTLSKRFGSWLNALEKAGLPKTINSKDVSNSDLLADLKHVADEIQKSGVTRSEYNEHGQFSYRTLTRQFGSWQKALEQAGLNRTQNFYENLSDDDLITDLKRVASELEKSSVTMDEYDERGKFGSGTLRRRFGRSWSKAVKLAGLTKSKNLNTPNEELFTNLAEIWAKLGRQPKGADLTSQTSKFSCDTYTTRFGSWRKALETFVAWANEGETQTAEISPQPLKSSRQKEISHKPDIARAPSPSKPLQKQEVFRHRTPRTVNDRLRFLMMRRDNFKCCICGISPAINPGTVLVADHIKSWDAGGETVIENLQTLCETCNGGKSNLDMYQNESRTMRS